MDTDKLVEPIKKYIMEHLDLLVKGVPLIVIIWMAYPLIITTWSWFPWIWASYETYKMLPKGLLNKMFQKFVMEYFEK
mgnify:CR=1 FL=1